MGIGCDCKSALPPSRFCGYTPYSAVVVVEARPFLIATESIAMIIVGIIASFAALGALCWMLFNLAVFALPFFAGVSARNGRVPLRRRSGRRFRCRHPGRRSDSGRRPVRRHAPAIAAASRRRRAAVCGSGGVRRLPRVPRDRCDDHALRSVAAGVGGSGKPDCRHHGIRAALAATSPVRVERGAERTIPAGEVKPSALIPQTARWPKWRTPAVRPGGLAMLGTEVWRADGPDVNWPLVSEGASGNGAMADRLDCASATKSLR